MVYGQLQKWSNPGLYVDKTNLWMQQINLTRFWAQIMCYENVYFGGRHYSFMWLILLLSTVISYFSITGIKTLIMNSWKDLSDMPQTFERNWSGTLLVSRSLVFLIWTWEGPQSLNHQYMKQCTYLCFLMQNGTVKFVIYRLRSW